MKSASNDSRIAVVLPTLNEAGTIGRLIMEILSLNRRTRIYVVDDGSTDGTASIVKGLTDDASRLTLCERERGSGLGAALRFGLRKALAEDENEVLVTMDADYSHDPSDMQKLLDVDADLVVGSRYIKNSVIVDWPFPRRLMSMTANWLARTRLGINVRDVTSGYRAYSREVAGLVISKSTSDRFVFQMEAVWLAERAGFRVKEVPIRFSERALGSSKLIPFREIRSTLSFLAHPARGAAAHT
ncbi:MAG TPA: polyprenol monophosphomannose synthase [Thermoproteota archaeon]|nr:polyprenol monophosphomannose synthase [Thermoproteota archaeon]